MTEKYYRYSCFAYRTFSFDKSFIFEGGDVPSSSESAGKATEVVEGAGEKPPVDQEAVDKADEEAREGGNKIMIEAGARIQASSVDEGPGHLKDTDTFGGEVVGRYVLTDPTKPYIALTVPVAFKYESTAEANSGQVLSMLSDAYTISAGVGVEGGVPIADVVTIYAGVGAEAGVRIFDYAMINEDLQTEEGTLFAPDIAAFGNAGVRINPIASWHLYAGIKPTVTFTGGPGLKENEPVFNVPVHVGTGFSF